MDVINAGKLRHTIIIQQRTVTRDAQGGFATSWSNYLTLRASIEQLSDPHGRGSHPGSRPDGREYGYAGATSGEISHIIHTRAQVDLVDDKMRIVFGSRVFQIISSVRASEIRHLQKIWVKETIGVVAETANVSAKLRAYPWGEIDFTIPQTVAIGVDTGKKFFVNKFEGAVTTLTGTVLTQPTINLGIATNHTKYLNGVTFTLLNALLVRQTFDIFLADNGETDLWFEIVNGGSVDTGSYRGSLVAFGDQIG